MFSWTKVFGLLEWIFNQSINLLQGRQGLLRVVVNSTCLLEKTAGNMGSPPPVDRRKQAVGRTLDLAWLSLADSCCKISSRSRTLSLVSFHFSLPCPAKFWLKSNTKQWVKSKTQMPRRRQPSQVLIWANTRRPSGHHWQTMPDSVAFYVWIFWISYATSVSSEWAPCHIFLLVFWHQ